MLDPAHDWDIITTGGGIPQALVCAHCSKTYSVNDDAENKRLREALHQIADKTYATQYGAEIGAVIRFASEIHHIARAAIEPVADSPPLDITAPTE